MELTHHWMEYMDKMRFHLTLPWTFARKFGATEIESILTRKGIYQYNWNYSFSIAERTFSEAAKLMGRKPSLEEELKKVQLKEKQE